MLYGSPLQLTIEEKIVISCVRLRIDLLRSIALKRYMHAPRCINYTWTSIRQSFFRQTSCSSYSPKFFTANVFYHTVRIACYVCTATHLCHGHCCFIYCMLCTALCFVPLELLLHVLHAVNCHILCATAASHTVCCVLPHVLCCCKFCAVGTAALCYGHCCFIRTLYAGVLQYLSSDSVANYT